MSIEEENSPNLLGIKVEVDSFAENMDMFLL